MTAARWIGLFLILIVRGLAWDTAIARGTVIDPFEEGPFTYTTQGIFTQNGLSTVVGGQRVVQLFGNFSSATLAITSADDSTVLSPASPAGGSFDLFYGGIAPLNADLTVGGASGLAVRLSSATGSNSIDVTLFDGINVKQIAQSYVASASEEDVYYPFSAFIGVDPTHISNIHVRPFVPSFRTLSITQIDSTSAPEPSATALLVGCAALFLARRRP